MCIVCCVKEIFFKKKSVGNTHSFIFKELECHISYRFCELNILIACRHLSIIGIVVAIRNFKFNLH